MTTHLETKIDLQVYSFFGDGTNIGVDIYVGEMAYYPVSFSFSLTELLEQTLLDVTIGPAPLHKEDREYILGLVDRLQEELAAFSKRLESV